MTPIPKTDGLFVPPDRAARWLRREAGADARGVHMAILIAAQAGATRDERLLLDGIGRATHAFLTGLADAVEPMIPITFKAVP